MRPVDPAGGEPREITLFEQWMGMTPDEWEALGAPDEERDRGPLPALHEQRS
ncbi:hypothetical protein [Curtobacterium sp. B18]|uniref:hypothetical protein n=1 Tax=Curtobacterium sp. B18 TaxID=95614 RepID=UPI00034DF617|nr:hypothetical protein [Curtobacterium sp. B18]